MVRDTELAKLKLLQEARLKLEQAQSDLQGQRRLVLANTGLDAASLTGANDLWLGWAAAQARMLSIKSAQAAASAETQIVQARRALGRAQVLAKLLERASPSGQ